jgi:hypothetical protein
VQCRIGFQPVSGAIGRSLPGTIRPLLVEKRLQSLWRKFGFSTVRRWSGETGWKPILHCVRASLRWGRGNIPLNAFFLGMACRFGSPRTFGFQSVSARMPSHFRAWLRSCCPSRTKYAGPPSPIVAVRKILSQDRHRSLRVHAVANVSPKLTLT